MCESDELFSSVVMLLVLCMVFIARLLIVKIFNNIHQVQYLKPRGNVTHDRK